MKHLSASALAKSLGTSPKDVLAQLAERGLIEMKGKSWTLTDKGKACGGQYRKSDYGTYIAWPKMSASPNPKPPRTRDRPKRFPPPTLASNSICLRTKSTLMLSELG